MTSVGHPVLIVYKNEETGTFELHEAALKDVLLGPAVADKPVCVVAVAGAFRRGKSFLLDFFLRYCINRKSENWLSDQACPLQGFRWRQGPERETTGIHIWSEPFIVEGRTGEEIALILMDTQGTFDMESSFTDSSVVFALSLLTSSLLVYNLSNQIQEDDLMNLQTFISYGLQACDDLDDSTAFQRILFLVRDWGCPAQVPYGHESGQKFLERLLEIQPGHSPLHRELRRDIRKCFAYIDCYLMPHPGVRVLENAAFDGRLSEIDQKFVEHLGKLVPLLLAPENLIKKEFGGLAIGAKDLFDSFKMFIEVFKKPDLVNPTTMAECMAQASSQAALGAGKELYVQGMDAFVRKNQAVEVDQLQVQHENFKLKAINFYQEKNKFGARNPRVFQQSKEKLENEIAELRDVQYMPRATSHAALEVALERYSAAMEDLIRGKPPTVKLQLLEGKREEEKQNAIICFQHNNELGKKNMEIFEDFQALLEQKVDQLLEVKFLAEARSQAARETGVQQYVEAMDRLVRNDDSTITLDTLLQEHKREKQNAVMGYQERNGTGRKNDVVFRENQKLMEYAIEDLHQAEYMPRVSSQTALEASKKHYKKAMDDFLQQQHELTLEGLRVRHEEEQQKTVAEYQDKNILGHKNSTIFEEYLQRLREATDQLYETVYVPRVGSQTTLAACKNHYTDVMDGLVSDTAPAISVDQLIDFHFAEKEDAIANYRTENTFGLKNSAVSEDILTRLRKELDELHDVEYKPRVSSRAALNACLERYKEAMRDCSGERDALTTDSLRTKHEAEKRRAISDFLERNVLGRRNPTVSESYKELLLKQIDEARDEELALRTDSLAVLEDSLQLYVSAMEAYISSSQTPSIPAVTAKHEEEIQRAITNYQKENERARKNLAAFEGFQNLLKKKADQFFEVHFLSETSSRAARETGVQQYLEAMDRLVRNDDSTITLETLEQKHQKEKQNAVMGYQERNGTGKKNDVAFRENQKLMEDAIEDFHQAEYMPRVSSQTALEASKKRYKKAMDDFLQHQHELTLERLTARHEEEQQQAVAHFKNKNDIGLRDLATYEDFLRCLREATDQLYETVYVPRVGSQATLAACKNHYTDEMDGVVSDTEPAISVAQLKDFHSKKKQDAKTKYRNENTLGKINVAAFEDCLTRLQKELDELHRGEYMPRVCSRVAFETSLERYKAAMRDCSGDKEMLTLDGLMSKHEAEKPKAINAYLEQNKLDIKNERVFEEYKARLSKQIDEVRDQELALRTGSLAVLEDSLQLYVNAMKTYLRQSKIPSVEAFEEKHEKELQGAIENYHTKNDNAENNSAVFQGYEELLKKDVLEVWEKDEEIIKLKNENDVLKRVRKACVLQ